MIFLAILICITGVQGFRSPGYRNKNLRGWECCNQFKKIGGRSCLCLFLGFWGHTQPFSGFFSWLWTQSLFLVRAIWCVGNWTLVHHKDSACKASIQPAVLSLWPRKLFCRLVQYLMWIEVTNWEKNCYNFFLWWYWLILESYGIWILQYKNHYRWRVWKRMLNICFACFYPFHWLYENKLYKCHKSVTSILRFIFMNKQN